MCQHQPLGVIMGIFSLKTWYLSVSLGFSLNDFEKKNTFGGRSAKPGRICQSKAGHHLGQLHLIIFDPDLGFMSRN